MAFSTKTSTNLRKVVKKCSQVQAQSCICCLSFFFGIKESSHSILPNIRPGGVLQRPFIVMLIHNKLLLLWSSLSGSRCLKSMLILFTITCFRNMKIIANLIMQIRDFDMSKKFFRYDRKTISRLLTRIVTD